MKLSAQRRLPLIVVFLILGLSLHNFLNYDPRSGYDANGHFSHIHQIAETGEVRLNTYSASNPPLYYWFMAALWKLTQGEKALQFVSLALYWLGCFVLFQALRLVGASVAMASLLTLGFAFLPVNLAYSLNVFNYALANPLLYLGVVYMLYLFRSEITLARIALLALIASAATLTALTALSLVVLVGVFALIGPVSKTPRWKLLLTALGVMGIFLVPYFTARIERVGCATCSLHRGRPWEEWWLLRPLWYYLPTRLTLLFQNPVQEGPFRDWDMWTYLHGTTFGDYWNYLISPHNQYRPGFPVPLTGRHAVDAQRLRGLRIVMGLALPVVALGGWAVLSQAVRWAKRGRDILSRGRSETLLFMFCVLQFAQFFVYCHTYRDPVSLHGGYLLGAYFALCVLLGIYSQRASRRWNYAFGGVLVVFSLASGWVFYL